ncbi:NEL-type E3 ubiquitin ligase domain-containing protein [Undibacterium sp. SXout7W]|uniref:NEL-type E3 ubiquitin ligase domain-containing protein n=1 Tax=Undibacterium sp. SXout7W TaxID=3413049 RepID=UPI003BF08863
MMSRINSNSFNFFGNCCRQDDVLASAHTHRPQEGARGNPQRGAQRRNARQEAILSQLNETALHDWAENGSQGENRAEAVSTIINWVRSNNAAPHPQPLILRNLGLTALPEEGLPRNVQILDVSGNRLRQLPRQLPASLKSLDANNNRLTSLPERLPANLQELHVGHNQLTNLPMLQEGLHYIALNNNLLTNLPHLPQSLRSLEACDNGLVLLPDNILTLPRHCTIRFNGTRLPISTRDQLIAATQAEGYNNARIMMEMDHMENLPPPPLQDSVSAWEKEAGKTTATDWSAFAGEESASSFSDFLIRLRETSEYDNTTTRPHFQQRVFHILEQIGQDSDLRKIVFTEAHEAMNFCSDRVATGILNIENACLNQRVLTDIQVGKYDNAPHEVVEHCKAQYRQEKLHEATSNKLIALRVTNPEFDEDIEVNLGFIVAFSQEFTLNAPIKSMRHASCSMITPEDVADIRKNLTNQDFTQDTKKFYEPFFVESPDHTNRLNALPAYQLEDSEKEQNNAAFGQFLRKSDQMTALLARKYPNADSNYKNEIAIAETTYENGIENLELSDPEYNRKITLIKDEYSEACETAKEKMASLFDHFFANNKDQNGKNLINID